MPHFWRRAMRRIYPGMENGMCLCWRTSAVNCLIAVTVMEKTKKNNLNQHHSHPNHNVYGFGFIPIPNGGGGKSLGPFPKKNSGMGLLLVSWWVRSPLYEPKGGEGSVLYISESKVSSLFENFTIASELELTSAISARDVENPVLFMRIQGR